MDFGFKRVPSSVINLDNIDRTKITQLTQMEPDVRRCMACGSCSATCTASPYSGMSLRKVIIALQRGKDAEAEAMLRNCMLCGKCTMVCPRGINTRHLILSICRVYGGEDNK